MTYPATPCFVFTPTGHWQVTLRRFAPDTAGPCVGREGDGRCLAAVVLGTEPHEHAPASGDVAYVAPHLLDDPRWPARCDRCGEAFDARSERFVNYQRLYTRSDGGPDTTLRDAPPGAMWDADWMPAVYKNPDGRCLCVRLPNGLDWMIDGVASNCTKPGDRVHRCWVRHGEPPVITVDKAGLTCDAGAGSILSGDYHGFLQDGVLTAG